MDKGFIIQLAASAAAVAVMIGVAAWARISKPIAPLNDARARTLLTEEFPGRVIDRLWVAVDGRGALAKSGAAALVLYETGDGYSARHIPWAQAISSTFKNGELKLDLADVAAPRAILALPAWPPQDLAA